MAYRFLLEVPETLAPEAQVAVERTPDAQVLLVRDSHGLGFEDPYVDLTVAAHTLQVVQSLYDWFDTLGASRPDIRIVLHDGARVSLEAMDRGAMVAAIRRDQPWVERSIPKVGEHDTEGQTVGYTIGAGLSDPERSIDAVALNAPVGVAVAGGDRRAALERTVALRRINHLAIQVNDLAKAERFYAEFFQMDLVGRMRRGRGGVLEAVNGAYRWEEATASGTEADVTFLANGGVTLALHRAGRGERLSRGTLDHLSVSVDATTFTNLKGAVLTRPLTILANRDTALMFRDPFGLVWELTVEGTVPARPL